MIPLKLIDDKDTMFGVERIKNRQRVSTKSYYTEMAEENISGHKTISKFGFDDDVDSSHQEVWTGSRAYPYMSTASVLYLSSSNTNDDQPYEVQGLDGDWRPSTIRVTANGFLPITLPGTWIRIFRVKNIGVTDNAGIIYIHLDADPGGDGVPDTIATDSKAEIAVGRNQTLMTMWPVPLNNTAFITQFYASCAHATAKIGEIGLWVRPFGGVFQIKKIISINSGRTATIKYDFPLKVESKSDIRVTAKSATALTVSAGFDVWYEEL